MNFIRKSESYSRFRIVGKFEFAHEKVQSMLDQNQFLDLSECGENQDDSYGWVSPLSCLEPPYIGHIMQDPYLCLSVRCDVRKLNKTLLKAKVEKKEKSKAQKLGREKLTRQEKQDIRLEVRRELLEHSPIKTTLFRALWNTHSQICFLFSNSSSIQKIFSELFIKTFGLEIELQDPTSLAQDWAKNHNVMDELEVAEPSSFKSKTTEN